MGRNGKRTWQRRDLNQHVTQGKFLQIKARRGEARRGVANSGDFGSTQGKLEVSSIGVYLDVGLGNEISDSNL